MLSHEATQVTVARKIREIYLAQELEKRYTKDQVLAMYLNTVYFGDGAYGAEAAARHYFDKSAKDLTLAQAAMLAGPARSRRAASTRMTKDNLPRRHRPPALGAAEDARAGLHHEDPVHEGARGEALVQVGTAGDHDGIYAAPYFVSYVKKQLQVVFGTDSRVQGRADGATRPSTLKMQAQAERAVKDILNQPGDPAAAVVSIDPGNGYIRAMVGGNDYSKSKLNLATQGKRQPGSSFKTFVLVTALEKGIPPKRRVRLGLTGRHPREAQQLDRVQQ